jgi:hypothetical protein
MPFNGLVYTKEHDFADGASFYPATLDGIQEGLGTQLAKANVSAGVNDGTNKYSGALAVATEQSTVSTSFALLTTPDRIQSIVLPAMGLIHVLYQATWRCTTAGEGYAGIFLGNTQLKRASIANASASDQTAVHMGNTANKWQPLASFGGGLIGDGGPGAWGVADYPGDVTTGMVVGAELGQDAGGDIDQRGGAAVIFAAAGTYDVSVRFRAGVGTVSVKDRKLWVWVRGFPT